MQNQLRFFFTAFSVIVFFLFGSACSTFSKQECQTMNFSAEAERLALDGFSLQEVSSYFDKECRVENDVQVNAVDLSSGFEKGQKRMCTTEGLSDLVRRGLKYKETCPNLNVETLSTYYKSYSERLELENKDLQGKVMTLENKVRSLQSQLEAAQAQKP